MPTTASKKQGRKNLPSRQLHQDTLPTRPTPPRKARAEAGAKEQEAKASMSLSMSQMMALASSAGGMAVLGQMATPLPHADMRLRSEPLKEKLLLQHTDASAHHT